MCLKSFSGGGTEPTAYPSDLISRILNKVKSVLIKCSIQCLDGAIHSWWSNFGALIPAVPTSLEHSTLCLLSLSMSPPDKWIPPSSLLGTQDQRHHLRHAFCYPFCYHPDCPCFSTTTQSFLHSIHNTAFIHLRFVISLRRTRSHGAKAHDHLLPAIYHGMLASIEKMSLTEFLMSEILSRYKNEKNEGTPQLPECRTVLPSMVITTHMGPFPVIQTEKSQKRSCRVALTPYQVASCHMLLPATLLDSRYKPLPSSLRVLLASTALGNRMQGEPNACFKTSANSSPSQLVLPSIKVTGDYPSFRSLHADFFKAFHSMLTPLGSKSFCKRFRLTRLLLLPRTEERCWQQAGVRLHFSNLGVGAKEV